MFLSLEFVPFVVDPQRLCLPGKLRPDRRQRYSNKLDDDSELVIIVIASTCSSQALARSGQMLIIVGITRTFIAP